MAHQQMLSQLVSVVMDAYIYSFKLMVLRTYMADIYSYSALNMYAVKYE